MLQLLASFLEQLAEVMWVSNNCLSHAHAWLRYLHHTRTHKQNAEPEETTHMCDAAVLAVLCVPADHGKSQQVEAVVDTDRRVTRLLGKSLCPTRGSLHDVVVSRDILSCASEGVQLLHALMERDAAPVAVLCKACIPVLKSIEESSSPYGPSLKRYVPKLKAAIFAKSLSQLSSVYSSLSIECFTDRVCPSSFLPWHEAEGLLVRTAKRRQLRVRLDYAASFIHFTEATQRPEKGLRHNMSSLASQMEAALASSCITSLLPADLQSLAIQGTPLWLLKARQDFESGLDGKLEIEAEQRRLAAERLRSQKQHHVRWVETEKKAMEVTARTKILDQSMQRRQEQMDLAIERQSEDRKREAEARAKDVLAEIGKIAKQKTAYPLLFDGKPWDALVPEDVVSGRVTYNSVLEAQKERSVKERQELMRQRRLECKRMDHVVRALHDENTQLIPDWMRTAAVEDEATKKKLREKVHSNLKLKRSLADVADVYTSFEAACQAEFEAQRDAANKSERSAATVQLKRNKVDRARHRLAKERDEQKKKQEEQLREERQLRQETGALFGEALPRDTGRRREEEPRPEDRRPEDRDTWRKGERRERPPATRDVPDRFARDRAPEAFSRDRDRDRGPRSGMGGDWRSGKTPGPDREFTRPTATVERTPRNSPRISPSPDPFPSSRATLPEPSKPPSAADDDWKMVQKGRKQ
eukprot:Polyplicarium_translucidae@DN1329_c0_g1_i1.p1